MVQYHEIELTLVGEEDFREISKYRRVGLSRIGLNRK